MERRPRTLIWVRWATRLLASLAQVFSVRSSLYCRRHSPHRSRAAIFDVGSIITRVVRGGAALSLIAATARRCLPACRGWHVRRWGFFGFSQDAKPRHVVACHNQIWLDIGHSLRALFRCAPRSDWRITNEGSARKSSLFGRPSLMVSRVRMGVTPKAGTG